MTTVELLVRTRFLPLPGATARRVGANAWEVHIPRTEAVARLARRGLDPEDWDGAVFAIDGEQTEPAVASGADEAALKVAALVL